MNENNKKELMAKNNGRISPARNVCLNLLMRYDGISYEEALNKVQNESLDTLLEFHDARAKVDALKQAAENVLMPNGGEFDSSYFYDKCGEDVYTYFDNFFTFDLDFDLMIKFLLDSDDDPSDSLVMELMRKYHDIYLKNAIKSFDKDDEETADYISIMPAPWLMRQLPFESLSLRDFGDLVMIVDCFANRSDTKLGFMDENDFVFRPNADVLKSYLQLQVKFFEDNGLNSHEDMMHYVENIVKNYPVLQNANKEYLDALQQTIELDNGFDQPAFEAASFLEDTLECAISELEYFRVHGKFR